ncbi:hypothetical protein LQ50_16130 [Halalkalibacter okhensis]|uniref:Uncharacterized protein n=1 Tax=Halalkalibacter okhensis TaxID=333138 RepID=A0A0B0IHU2_9BACI|nr:hypothetical protein LQ50_16130 [Halalkalibacter okhensis]
MWVLLKRKKNAGYTLFVPSGVRHEYPLVDLTEQKVVGTVIYKDKVYLKVLVNLKEDTVSVEGSVSDLGDLSMDKESYIDMFQSDARFFVNNHISDPQKYYEELNESIN